MALQIMTNINVDFYDKKYILINAKQYDDCSRWVSVTCYNNGKLFNISPNEHSVYVRYRKADGHGILNSCRINYKGEVLVELTEQMLAASGICYVDLIIVNKGSAIVDIDTGKITIIDNSAVMSTMAFCINVYEASFDNSVIESSYEFNALNELLQKADADYKEIVQLARSYAIGDAGDIRENEDYDNSKYYCEQSFINASNAKTSETNAMDNANLAKSYAVGGTGTRENEDEDNSQYYYELTKIVVEGINNSFVPMGTISFSELVGVEKVAGFTYNISDDFVTDDTFKEGAGKPYAAGTNVYCTADGYWDCLSGTAVVGIKGANETEYRKGNVNLTAENVGAIPSVNIATVDEVKSYLGI